VRTRLVIDIEEVPMPRGRARTFDVDLALDRALEMFWRHGYEGTSIVDLTQAMSISAPSLYAAFGSKRQLFERAADRYAEIMRRETEQALTCSSVRESVRQLLTTLARANTSGVWPVGCFNVQAAMACGEGDRDVVELLSRRRLAVYELLAARFERAAAEGELPDSASTVTLARFVATVASGIAVQAASGVPGEELKRMAEITVSAIPPADIAPDRYDSHTVIASRMHGSDHRS
jgi:AcrR family transcriptional regulator